MNNYIAFKHGVGERVEIIEIGRTGEVIEVRWDGIKVQYLVRYFDNSSPNSVIFYVDELRGVVNELEHRKD